MRTRHSGRAATIILLVFLGTLPVVGGLQYHLLDQAAAAEVSRLQRSAESVTRLVRNEIAYEVASLATILSGWIGTAGPVSDLVRLYGAWASRARFPDLVAEIVVRTHTGAGDRILRYEPGAPGFDELDTDGYSWLDAPTADPLVIRLPAAPLFRAPGDPIRDGDRARDSISVSIRLDESVLATTAIPALVDESLGSDSGGLQVALVDRTRNVILHSTAPVSPAQLVPDPSRARPPEIAQAVPLVWPGNQVTILGRIAGGTEGRPQGRPTDELPSDLAAIDRNPILEQWLAIRDPERPGARAGAGGSSEERASDDEAPSLAGPGLYLVVWHEAGSIQRAALIARNQNLLLSLGFLVSVGGVAMLFHALYRRAHRQREREQEFLASVTHELRTPIAAMHGASENLAAGIVTDPARVRDYGRALLDEGRRLRAMIDQTLAYARLQASAGGSTGPVDVGELVERVVTASDLLAPGQAIVDLEAGLPVWHGDATALGSILVNLVGNAAKHCPPGTPIRLSVRRERTRRGSWLVVRVADDGPGIPRRELRRIREPFFRGSASQERQVPGAGLGLTIVDRVVTKTGGKLDIESVMGVGTTVTVRLPAGSV